MNCGLGNLTSLKQHLLGKTMQANTNFDSVIRDVGLGVARLIEQYCNRALARAENSAEIFPADRCVFLVKRFPIESIASAHVLQNRTDGWVEQADDFIVNFRADTGLIFTAQNTDVGLPHEQVRFTYTGGYFIELLEPEEGVTDQPAGSEALPDDVRLAWLLMCRLVYSSVNKLGTDILKEGPDSQFVTGTLAGLEMPQQIKDMLAPHRRIQMI